MSASHDLKERYPVFESIASKAHVDAARFEEMSRKADQDPEGFWGEVGKRIDWIKPYSRVKDVSFSLDDLHIRWFDDGTLNVCANCVDRHLEKRGDQTAILWEGDDPERDAKITYRELYERVCRFANVLKKLGVQKGDRVTLYLPMIPESAVAMLACARIGAVHSVVFGGFSPDALAGRIIDCDSKIVVTADAGVRGGRSTGLKKNVDAALKNPEAASRVESVLVVRNTGDDVAWVTGHSYIVYGPLANGATSLMFEGVPNYPDHSRFWQVCDKHQVNIFYTAPTAIRALMREGNEPVERTSRKSLRILGSVGEPINPEAWHWYFEVVGNARCPIVDTWWQTETGGILISPLPGATALKPGSATRPLPGIQPVLLGPEGEVLEGAAEGNLVISDSWPGQMRTVYGDHKRFGETYFSAYPGYYFTGDGARRDEDGFYWITGRVDDVINVSGHRLGTAEVESALVAHTAVAEAAVVGFPHDIKGQGVYAYVTLMEGREGNDDLATELVKWVRTEIGPIATIDHLQWAPGLPKTRSGKIMRRILRKIAANELDQLGGTSTLADPDVVDHLVANRRQD